MSDRRDRASDRCDDARRAGSDKRDEEHDSFESFLPPAPKKRLCNAEAADGGPAVVFGREPNDALDASGIRDSAVRRVGPASVGSVGLGILRSILRFF